MLWGAGGMGILRRRGKATVLIHASRKLGDPWMVCHIRRSLTSPRDSEYCRSCHVPPGWFAPYQADPLVGRRRRSRRTSRSARAHLGRPTARPASDRCAYSGVVEHSVYIDADPAVALVQAMAGHFNVDQRALGHEISEYQSGRRAGHDRVNERDQLADVARSFTATSAGRPDLCVN